MLGEIAHRPLLRSTARPGDVVGVTGALGRAGAGLAALELGSVPAGVAPAALAALTAAHLRPRPRVREGCWLGAEGSTSAMMDLSDGLATDLPRLCAASGVGARVELARLPVDEATRAVAAALDADPLGWATGGGEDYELLISCPPDAFDRLARELAGATGARLTPVGEIVAAPGVTWLDAEGCAVPATPGWEHFARERRNV
jgi:thiamine-monophosphate kinase